MADDDKKEMLNSLRIDRQAAPRRSNVGRWFTASMALAVLGAAAWWFNPLAGSTALAVETVLVEAPRSSSAGNSVLDASGYVIARRQATVSSKTTGRVTDVFIEEGMRVDAGQLLARLDDSVPKAEYALSESQLRAARAGLAEVAVQIEQAKLDQQRQQELLDRKLTSQADADRARLSLRGLQARHGKLLQDIAVSAAALAVQKQLLDDLEIRAPFQGVVVAKAAQPGEMISPISAGSGFTRTGICTIVDMDSLEVEVDVNEAYINRVIAEQPVTIVLNAYPDWQIRGAVIAIIPTADRNKATVRVRIGIVDKDPRILPDMGVKVSFLGAVATTETQGPEPLSIPVKTVQSVSIDPHVFVVAGDRLERRSVQLGAVRGERVAVLDGLSGGERLVAATPNDPNRVLSTGMMVTVVP